jgi:hypothetical protein
VQELDQGGQQLARLPHKFIQVRDAVAVGSSIPGRQNWCWGIVVAVDMAGESHRGSG